MCIPQMGVSCCQTFVYKLLKPVKQARLQMQMALGNVLLCEIAH